jgi:hypothetical protein
MRNSHKFLRVEGVGPIELGGIKMSDVFVVHLTTLPVARLYSVE